MSRNVVVVWVTDGGIVEHVASPGVEVVVIDYQNIGAGDDVPELSDAQLALLQKEAPYVLEDLARIKDRFAEWLGTKPGNS